MASETEIAERYFQALNDHDLNAAAACWASGGIDGFVGQQDLIAPEGVREYFGALFSALPDFSLEVLDTTTAGSRAAVRWQARGTFAGPGRFQGFEPNGAQIEIEGCDVITVGDELIQHIDAYLDGGDIARQLGFLPPAGSAGEARLTKLANARTNARPDSRHPARADRRRRLARSGRLPSQGNERVWDGGRGFRLPGLSPKATRSPASG